MTTPLIDSWLSKTHYMKTLSRPLPNDAETQNIRTDVIRTLPQWKQITKEAKPGDQSFHIRVPQLIYESKIYTGWLGKGSQTVSEIKILRDGANTFQGLKINCQGMGAQERAILELITCYTYHKNKKPKLMIAEPFSQLSLQIRGRYPFAIATGYTPESPYALFPLKNIDLQNINFPGDSFDILISSEIYEHLPKPQRSLEEARRILKEGGIYLFTCPFHWNTYETLVKAKPNEDGSITHCTKPEYHGDPLRPKDGALVYQIPGWDLIDNMKAAGFRDAAACYLSNVYAGIVGYHISGCFVFIGHK